MRNPLRSKLTVTLCSILIVLPIIAACVPAPAAAPPAPAERTAQVVETMVTAVVAERPGAATQPETIVEPPTAQSCKEASVSQIITATKAIPTPVGSRRCFAPDQIITFGTDIDTTNVITAELEGAIPLKEIQLKLCQQPLKLPRFPEAAQSQLVWRLYQLPAGVRASDAITRVNNSPKNNGAIRTEPNYLLGNPGTPLKGKPWIPAGSPGANLVDAPNDRFWKQPAFAQIGLPLPSNSGGKGVRVGVFDAVPADFVASNGSAQEVTFTLPTNDQPHKVKMCVAGLQRSFPIETAGPFSSEDHGLFVAGLVKAVAPEADVYLYQVLDSSLHGDLFTLLEAIKSFVCTGQPERSVVNLSLGLNWYPPMAPAWNDCGGWSEEFREIRSLKDLLDSARALGVVVTAAAGNNANNANNEPQDADIPAQWEGVIGVAAVNPQGGLACFSNAGDVSAPGGEGLETSATPPQCTPPFDTCPTLPGGCDNYGLVSIATHSPTGYAYWAGTSFATPLVSGLAARCMADNVQAQSNKKWAIADTALGVQTAIENGAVGPTKMISVTNTVCK